MRVAGGAPETFTLFFVTLACISLGFAFNNFNLFYWAGLWTGLAYLARNESLWGVIVLIGIFIYCRRNYSVETNERPSWNILWGSLLIFLVVISPWEIRNHLIYGKAVNAIKYSLVFGRDYYNGWSCSHAQNSLWAAIRYQWGIGFKKLLVMYLQSYYYKIDTCVQIYSWPIVSLLLLGIARNFRQREYWPVYGYFIVTYPLMSFFQATGQGAGWHTPGTLLALIIPLALSGAYFFGSLVTKNPRHAKRIGWALCMLVFLYHLGDNYKQYRLFEKVGFKNGTETYAKDIQNYFNEVQALQPAANAQNPIVVMTHNPQFINFYTDIPTVQVPLDESIETIWSVIRKYHCNYLVLSGNIPSIFAKLYQGTEQIPGFHLVYEKIIPNIGLEQSGDRVKIFAIQPIE